MILYSKSFNSLYSASSCGSTGLITGFGGGGKTTGGFGLGLGLGTLLNYFPPLSLTKIILVYFLPLSLFNGYSFPNLKPPVSELTKCQDNL